jgi:hypothetical protein
MEEVMNYNLGELITTLYEENLTIYGSEDLASVATAATVNKVLSARAVEAKEALPPAPRSDAHAF